MLSSIPKPPSLSQTLGKKNGPFARTPVHSIHLWAHGNLGLEDLDIVRHEGMQGGEDEDVQS